MQNDRYSDTFQFIMLVLSNILELAFIAPETKRVLERLSHMPDVNVTIISGREMNDLRKKVSLKHFTASTGIILYRINSVMIIQIRLKNHQFIL